VEPIIEFSRGDATLIVEAGGLIYCEGFDLDSDAYASIRRPLQSLLQPGVTAKQLFLRLITLQDQIEGAKFIACVDEGDRVAVLTLSDVPFTITTDQSVATIDPSDRSFVMERVVAGQLMRCDIGLGGADAERYMNLGFQSYGGCLPVGACSIQFAAHPTNLGSVSSFRSPTSSIFDEAPKHALPVTELPVAELPVVDEQDQELDEEEMMTVWPTQGRAVSVAPDAPAHAETLQSVPVVPVVAPVIVPADAEIKPVEPVEPVVDVQPESTINTYTSNPSANEDWQPPVWQPNSEPINSTVPAITLAPRAAEPIVTWSAPGEPVVAVNDDELTMMESGVVTGSSRVTFNPPAIPTEGVVGTFCANNHFTDSRRLRCLFCDAETQFDRVDVGPRPKLGRLRFDDGRIIELQNNVLIGRKPTAPDGVVVDVVAFDDDRLLSRLHCEVRITDWDVVVVDRQSANGTSIVYPDGRRMATRANVDAPLELGSTVHFGRHTFVFESRKEVADDSQTLDGSVDSLSFPK
jgi:FHA domain